jgi:hypothetical protein
VSWSYSGDPSNSPLDELRFLLGDTDPDCPILSDEELNYILGKANNDMQAAVLASLQIIVIKYARLKDETVGDVQVKYSQIYDHYFDLLKKEQEAGSITSLSSGGIYAGGISVTDKKTRQSDPDRVQPKFFKDLGDSQFKGDISGNDLDN